MTYTPHKQSREILDRAMAYVQSVNYQVSARWLFYRLLQDGTYRRKAKYDTFLQLLSRARKAFYDGWRPDTLADETRAATIRGDGWQDEGHWVKGLLAAECELDKWAYQPRYVELWFEAAAMLQQFMTYTDHTTLVPFRGDASIPYKWEMARRIDAMALKHGRPVVILYFGDLDPKGLQIPESALNDIREWAIVDFEFVRAGLTADQVMTYGIPEQPDKPGAYQWEALDDPAAAEIIRAATRQYLDPAAFARAKRDEEEATRRWRQATAGIEG